jgi:PGM1 C-terminal domain/ATP-grasp domain
VDFETLELALPEMARTFVTSQTDRHGIVVVPSMTFDQELLQNVLGVEHYEERLLSMLLQLAAPHIQVVFCSSAPISEEIVDYYLDLIPGVPLTHARARLTMVTCDDRSPRPLTEKLMERPARIKQIQDVIATCRTAGIVCMNTTDLERKLAETLGIPLLGNPPDLDPLGSKSGSREIFKKAGVDLPAGFERLRSIDEATEALARLKAEHPHVKKAVVKLEEGFSGEGNATFDYQYGSDVQTIAEALPRHLEFQAKAETFDSFSAKYDQMGGIVEEFVDGVSDSPSAQGYIGPLGTLRALSTHDQLLGGGGQVFQGSMFPAKERYRRRVQDAMLKVGEVLQGLGARGRFAVDFVEAGDRLAAIEINLRKGGTTHPMLTMAVITQGHYDPVGGVFRTRTGKEKCYYSTDNLRSDAYRGMSVAELLDVAVTAGLTYNPVTERGCVFFMLGALSEFGKVSVTCIADNLDDAIRDYEKLVAVMDGMGTR